MVVCLQHSLLMDTYVATYACCVNVDIMTIYNIAS